MRRFAWSGTSFECVLIWKKDKNSNLKIWLFIQYFLIDA